MSDNLLRRKYIDSQYPTSSIPPAEYPGEYTDNDEEKLIYLGSRLFSIRMHL